MKVSTRVKQLVLAAAVSAVATGAMAARQGELGSTSDGDFDITYNQGAEVRIWGLQDVSFDGATDNVIAGELKDSFTFCTYSNNTEQVVFDVASQSPDFMLEGPGDVTLPYHIELADTGADVKDRWGSPTGQKSGDQGYYRYDTQKLENGGDGLLCATGQQTTDLTVTIPQYSEGDLADGAYTDTVTLTIKPI